jgi:hypothetical protein
MSIHKCRCQKSTLQVNMFITGCGNTIYLNDNARFNAQCLGKAADTTPDRATAKECRHLRLLKE